MREPTARQRAFCPISQIDSAHTSDPSIHEGQLYTFRIIEYKDDGKDLVVSRRALLEEEEAERAAVAKPQRRRRGDPTLPTPEPRADEEELR